jgi:hypothetical protein
MNKLLKHRVVVRTLEFKELNGLKALSWAAKRYLVVAGYSDFLRQQLVLFRADGRSVIAPFDMFEPSGTSSPNFYELEIIDYGNTIKLGEYEASAGSILEDLGY